ncbi:hypothetical protein [Nocardia wallacei]|nr:hypothetical protein [Nocardia wallacei]
MSNRPQAPPFDVQALADVEFSGEFDINATGFADPADQLGC